jgi:hypothetical protein
MRRNIFLISVFLIFGLSASSQKTQLLHFYLEAGACQSINTPVCTNLEGINKSDTLSFQLFEKVNEEMIEKPFQVEPGYVPVLWWILDGITSAGKTREFFLFKNVSQPVKNVITSTVTDKNIILKKGNSEILHYQSAVMYPPPGIDAYMVDHTSFLSVAGDSSIILEACRYGGGIGFRAPRTNT